jgi:hypothetical protein
MTRLALLTVTIFAAALACAGCSAPGAGHLKGTPKGTPPALAYLTGNSLGFSLLDADPEAAAWKPLSATVGAGEDNRLLRAQHAGLFQDPAKVDLADVAPWVGAHTGTLAYVLDVTSRDHDRATEYWADVRSRTKLETFLTAQGWTKGSKHDDLGEGLTRWTRDEGDGLHALGVANDAVVGARSSAGLDELVRAARKYSAKERNGMPDYAVEAAKRTPAAVVFRFDLVREQLQRPFQGDPAKLELAKWATASNALLAIRDGWVGLAPNSRVVGTWDWVPSLATNLKLGTVGEAARNQLDPHAAVSVAVHDPGQFITDELFTLTHGNIQYATEDDVSKGEVKVKLQPILDELDGDATISWSRSGGLVATVDTKDPAKAKGDVEAALKLAKLDGQVTAGPKGITIFVGGRAAPAYVDHAVVDWTAAGTPPRTPVAWLSFEHVACAGHAAGWLTFNGVGRMSGSFAVDDLAGCIPGAPAAPVSGDTETP